jgi:hypothetical protein
MKPATKLLFFCSLSMMLHLSNASIFGRHLIQDEEKGIQALEYLKKRPERKITPEPQNNISNRPSVKRYYRVAKPAKTKFATTKTATKKPIKTSDTALLGFTIWRFKTASKEDEKKGLVEVNPQTGNKQTTERLDSETPLPIGDLIRIGIESLSHDGYLYVIEREKYADGSYGQANLVFPTARTRGGNNFVRAGVLTFIPAAPNYFLITSNTEKKQVAEELIIIVSPKKLLDSSLLQIKPIEIPNRQLTEWLNQWAVEELQLEQIGGVGQTMTKAEQSAGLTEEEKGLTEVTPTLSQDDAPPQTIYQMTIKRGNPAIATVTLPIKPD